MRYLLVLLLLISPLIFGNWGDTYFCSMNTMMEVKAANEKITYQLETFKFRLDENKNAVVFPHIEKEQFFKDFELPITLANFAENKWTAGETNLSTYVTFGVGNFLFSGLNVDDENNLSMLNIIADCEEIE